MPKEGCHPHGRSSDKGTHQVKTLTLLTILAITGSSLYNLESIVNDTVDTGSDNTRFHCFLARVLLANSLHALIFSTKMCSYSLENVD